MKIIDEEGAVMVETRHIYHSQRFNNASEPFDDFDFSPETPPIRSIDNSSDFAYDITNNTLGSRNYNNNNPIGDGVGFSHNFTNHTRDGSGAEVSASDMIWTFAAPVILLFFCTLGQGRNTPSSQYHRGAMFRRQAERVWEIQRVKTERKAVPIEKRKSQIDESLLRMKVVSKCVKTGHCVLASPEEEEEEEEEEIAPNNDGDRSNESTSIPGEGPNDTNAADSETKIEENSASSSETEVMNDTTSAADGEENRLPSPSSIDPVHSAVAATEAESSNDTKTTKSCMKPPDSPGRNERRPLLSCDSDDSQDCLSDPVVVEAEEELNTAAAAGTSSTSSVVSATPATNASYYDDFEDDEDVCPICLDNFEVGDMVMWSRHNHGTCSHAFHEDCLLQWLLEQRENECPTCRACFINDPVTTNPTPSSPSLLTVAEGDESTFAFDELEENSIIDQEEMMGNVDGGDIEEGNGNSISHCDVNEIGADRSHDGGDHDEAGYEEADSAVEHEHNNTTTTEIIDDMEAGFTYVIVKGSVHRVPS